MPSEIKNIMTFDIEEWYHSNLDGNDPRLWDSYESRVVAPTLRFVEHLNETGNTGTFFILGKVAERFPEMVKAIQASGHEVASHSYDHQLVYEQSRAEFAADLEKSLQILEGITGEKILGFRAPSWSIGDKTPWVWEVMRANGLEYDASLYPFATFLYGSNSSPRFHHMIDVHGYDKIHEVPPSVVEVFGKRIPFCGGFFLRVLPYSFIKWSVNRINKKEGQTAVLYLHPWEIDVDIPRLKLSAKERFIKYANISQAEWKLRKLLEEFRFVSVREYLAHVKKQKLETVSS